MPLSEKPVKNVARFCPGSSWCSLARWCRCRASALTRSRSPSWPRPPASKSRRDSTQMDRRCHPGNVTGNYSCVCVYMYMYKCAAVQLCACTCHVYSNTVVYMYMEATAKSYTCMGHDCNCVHVHVLYCSCVYMYLRTYIPQWSQYGGLVEWVHKIV